MLSVGITVFIWGSHLDSCPRSSTGVLIPTIPMPDGVWIIYGQSNSECTVQEPVDIYPYVTVFHNGKLFEYAEPMTGSSQTGGCMWGNVARHLGGDHVMAVCGCTSSTVKELYDDRQHFITTLLGLVQMFGRVDGVIYHQGESDYKSVDNYTHTLSRLKQAADAIYEADWFIGRVSTCDSNKPNVKIVHAQSTLPGPRAFLGPNTDELVSNEDRYDGCHWTRRAALIVAEEWAEYIRRRIPTSRIIF